VGPRAISICIRCYNFLKGIRNFVSGGGGGGQNQASQMSEMFMVLLLLCFQGQKVLTVGG
jgi:hypothetical protein